MLDSASAATVVVVAMEGEMGSPNAGALMTEWMVLGSGCLFIVSKIQSYLGSGLRRPNGGEMGGRGVAFSRVVRE